MHLRSYCQVKHSRVAHHGDSTALCLGCKPLAEGLLLQSRAKHVTGLHGRARHPAMPATTGLQRAVASRKIRSNPSFFKTRTSLTLHFNVESAMPIIQILDPEPGRSAAARRYMIMEFSHWRIKAPRISVPAVAREVPDG